MRRFQPRRRSFLYGGAGAALGGAQAPVMSASAPSAQPGSLAARYELADDIVNLENACYGIMARPVAETNKQNINIAAVMTIPAALDFHGRMPPSARAIPGMQILTPDDPGMTGAVTSFRLAGRTSFEDKVALVRAPRTLAA